MSTEAEASEKIYEKWPQYLTAIYLKEKILLRCHYCGVLVHDAGAWKWVKPKKVF